MLPLHTDSCSARRWASSSWCGADLHSAHISAWSLQCGSSQHSSCRNIPGFVTCRCPLAGMSALATGQLAFSTVGGVGITQFPQIPLKFQCIGAAPEETFIIHSGAAWFAVSLEDKISRRNICDKQCVEWLLQWLHHWVFNLLIKIIQEQGEGGAVLLVVSHPGWGFQGYQVMQSICSGTQLWHSAQGSN